MSQHQLTLRGFDPELIGSWSDEEADEVLERTAYFDRVDEELWR